MNRMFIDRRSTIGLSLAEDVLPQNGKLRTSLEQYVGETPIFDFVHETLSRELYESQEYDSKEERLPLTRIEGYEEISQVAKRLVSEFQSLPWTYLLSVSLPPEVGQLFASRIKLHALSPTLTLATPDSSFEEQFPLRSGIEKRDRGLSGGLANLLLVPTPPEWDQATAYLQLRLEGFIGKYGETAPLEDGIARLKAFCGLGIALRLLRVNRSFRSTPYKGRVFIHRNINDRWVIERTHDLGSALSEGLNDLVLHDLEGILNTDAQREEWMRHVLSKMKCVFENTDQSRQILLASQWLFDSYCGRDQLLSFVQTAVVMEILLGDKAVSDLTGLGELLANRCAYLISDSHKERERILSDFRSIYDVRSKIVHRGKAKLNLGEWTLFSKLQWMCRRVIQKEVDLLEKDVEKSA